MSPSSLRSRAALTALVTSAALAVPATGLLSTTVASASATAAGGHVSVPSKFAPQRLVAIPHSSTAAIFGYGVSGKRRPGLEVPKGGHYVLRSFAKNVYPSTVVAASKTSFWAIGTASGHYEVLRLSGSTWKAVPLPAAAHSASLYAIAASSPSNVWVSGYLKDPASTGEDVLHWNGKKWSIVSLGDATDASITVIATSSSSNVWTVDGNDVLHFNGKTWTQPDSEQLGAVISIGTTASSNAWFLGADGAGATVTHWNGKAFGNVAVPGAKKADISSLSVAGSSAWIAGYAENSKGLPHQLAYRSTGGKWKSLKTPNYHEAQAGGIAASSTTHAELYVSESTGTTCTNFRATPILMSLSTSKATSVTKGRSYLTGCG